MNFPIVINYEKLTAYKLIKQHGITDLKNYGAVISEAWQIFGTTLTIEEVHFIGENYEKLLKEFGGEKEEII